MMQNSRTLEEARKLTPVVLRGTVGNQILRKLQNSTFYEETDKDAYKIAKALLQDKDIFTALQRYVNEQCDNQSRKSTDASTAYEVKAIKMDLESPASKLDRSRLWKKSLVYAPIDSTQYALAIRGLCRVFHKTFCDKDTNLNHLNQIQHSALNPATLLYRNIKYVVTFLKLPIIQHTGKHLECGNALVAEIERDISAVQSVEHALQSGNFEIFGGIALPYNAATIYNTAEWIQYLALKARLARISERHDSTDPLYSISEPSIEQVLCHQEAWNALENLVNVIRLLMYSDIYKKFKETDGDRNEILMPLDPPRTDGIIPRAFDETEVPEVISNMYDLPVFEEHKGYVETWRKTMGKSETIHQDVVFEYKYPDGPPKMRYIQNIDVIRDIEGPNKQLQIFTERRKFMQYEEEYRLDFCTLCGEYTPEYLIPCPNCPDVVFCSENCVSQADYHLVECGHMSFIKNLGHGLLPLRTFIKIGVENLIENQTIPVFRCPTPKTTTYSERFNAALSSVLGAIFLVRRTYPNASDEDFKNTVEYLTSALTTHYLQWHYGGAVVMAAIINNKVLDKVETKVLGTAFYEKYANLPHSCSPKVSTSTKSHGRIASGIALPDYNNVNTISFGPCYSNSTFDERASYLNNLIGGCKCDVCCVDMSHSLSVQMLLSGEYRPEDARIKNGDKFVLKYREFQHIRRILENDKNISCEKNNRILSLLVDMLNYYVDYLFREPLRTLKFHLDLIRTILERFKAMIQFSMDGEQGILLREYIFKSVFVSLLKYLMKVMDTKTRSFDYDADVNEIYPFLPIYVNYFKQFESQITNVAKDTLSFIYDIFYALHELKVEATCKEEIMVHYFLIFLQPLKDLKARYP